MRNDYIDEYNPETVSLPGDTLAEMLEERGMSQAELCERIGRPKKTINEILKGKASITPETAIQLERVFGVSASFWNNRQREYDECLARNKEAERLSTLVDWLDHFACVRDMMNKGWIPQRGKDVLTLDALLSFFGVNSPADWEAVWGKENIQAALRDSAAYKTDSYALAAYLRKAEIEASACDCAPYDPDAFREALSEARALTREEPASVRERLAALCAGAGVTIAFIHLIKGVHVAGAVRWIPPNRPVAAFSCRGRAEDIFWFSFFHEAAHILLHGKKKIFIETDNMRNDQENEADAFARDFLIDPKRWAGFARKGHEYSEAEIDEFARSEGVCPAIVLGRLQHEGLHPKQSYLNARKRAFSFE
jgi:HTH-type transcriptional regulator / antitoxin HigA